MSNPDARYDRKLIDMMIADGMAKAIKHPEGTAYLVTYDDGKVLIKPAQIIEAAEMPVILQDVPPTDVYNAKRARLVTLVEDYMTAMHGIAENRDGEFDAEAADMVERLMNDEEGEAANALSEAIWDAKYHAERNARLSDARIEFPAGSYSGGL